MVRRETGHLRQYAAIDLLLVRMPVYNRPIAQGNQSSVTSRDLSLTLWPEVQLHTSDIAILLFLPFDYR